MKQFLSQISRQKYSTQEIKRRISGAVFTSDYSLAAYSLSVSVEELPVILTAEGRGELGIMAVRKVLWSSTHCSWQCCIPGSPKGSNSVSGRKFEVLQDYEVAHTLVQLEKADEVSDVQPFSKHETAKLSPQSICET